MTPQQAKEGMQTSRKSSCSFVTAPTGVARMLKANAAAKAVDPRLSTNCRESGRELDRMSRWTIAIRNVESRQAGKDTGISHLCFRENGSVQRSISFFLQQYPFTLSA